MDKVIAKVKYFVKAEEITPLHWSHLKRSCCATYRVMQNHIRMYGPGRLMFGFDENLKPVRMDIAF